MLFLACFKVGRDLVPKITLFYTLKYKYFINHGLTTNPNKVGFDGTMIVEECLGTSDGAARSPPLAMKCSTEVAHNSRRAAPALFTPTNAADGFLFLPQESTVERHRGLRKY